MKKEKDFNYIAKIETPIEQRWGSAATHNPARYWDDEKEKEYLEQLKSLLNF